MNRFVVTIALVLFSLNSSGDSSAGSALEEQIATACQRHAISLSGELQNSMLPGLSESQAEQIRQTAMASCKSYLHKTLINNPTARQVAAEKSREEMIEKETTQETIKRWLSEEPKRNAGHDRLKKR